MSDVPERIGDYEIEGELGVGGMATVYKARHAILDTLHAIKVLDPSYRANATARQRFLDEAKIQAKHLDHPNIVKVTNIVATPEHAALVMELVEGPSLEAKLPELAGKPAEIKRIMLGILDAVQYAHDAGIIHRDLKPANVLLAKRGDQLIPKVTDFGIAKVTQGGDDKGVKKSTHADARMGTLHYMSPEQIRRSKDVTPRSDVYSLGALLYEMATGAVPFAGDSEYDMMENIVNGRYEPPQDKVADLDPVIATVIMKALQPDPANRYASCAEMAAALRGEAAPVARPVRAVAADPERIEVPPPKRRSKLPLVLGAIVAVAGIVIGGVVYVRAKTPKQFTTAEQVFDAAIAMEGVERLSRRTNVKYTGTVIVGGERHPFTAVVQAPQERRWSLEFGEGRISQQGMHNGVVWEFGGEGPKIIRGVQRETALREDSLNGGLHWRENNKKVALAGIEELAGKPTYKLIRTRLDGQMETDYVSVDSLLTVRTQSTTTTAGTQVVSTTDISDYREMDGIFYAHKIVTTDGTSTIETDVETVEVDAKLPPGYFDLPKEIEALRHEPNPDAVYAIPIDDLPIDPPGPAKITIVELSEHLCPYCDKVRPTLAALKAKYGGSLRVASGTLVVHPAAWPGELAACAARSSAKYAAMDDLLWKAYEAKQVDAVTTPVCYQTTAGCPIVLGFAKQLGFDLAWFKAEMRRCEAKIAGEKVLLDKLGVSGIPAFFINGRYLSGAQPVEAFSKVIDAELTRADARINKNGMTLRDYYLGWVILSGKTALDP